MKVALEQQAEVEKMEEVQEEEEEVVDMLQVNNRWKRKYEWTRFRAKEGCVAREAGGRPAAAARCAAQEYM